MKFDILGKKFGQKVQSTVSEVQKMNEIRQLNSRINDEKKQIQSIYTEIGKKLFRQQQDCPPEGFGVLFEEILECEEAITDYEQQIRDIRKVRICPNCHAEVSQDGKFCSSCGAELPAVNPVTETEDDFVDEFSQEEEPSGTAETVPQDIRENVEAAAGEIQENVEAAAGEIQENVETAAGEIHENVKTAVREAQELVREAKDIVEEISDPVRETPED